MEGKPMSSGSVDPKLLEILVLLGMILPVFAVVGALRSGDCSAGWIAGCADSLNEIAVTKPMVSQPAARPNGPAVQLRPDDIGRVALVLTTPFEGFNLNLCGAVRSDCYPLTTR